MIVQIFEYPGVTEEQYEAVIAAMNLDGQMPEGSLVHIAGPMEGGWRAIDVWESQEDFDRFHEEQLRHAQSSQGYGLPEQVHTSEVHTVLTHGRWHHGADG